jgi:hypothetical protein
MVILLPLLLAMAGCGGSSNPSLNKAQLAAQVNSVCSSFVSHGRQVPVPTDFATNPAAAAAYLDKIIKLTDDAYNTIKALAPDSSVATDFNAYVKAVGHDITLLKRADAKAHAKDRSGLAILAQETRYDRTVTRPLATKLGFVRCNG